MRKTWFHVTVGLILAFIILTQPVASQTDTPDSKLPFEDDLQAALDASVDEYNGIGISVAVVVPGYDAWVSVAGVSHESELITQDHLFGAGSITKNFIAIVVLQLADEGLLSLDDTVDQWLPDYPNIDNTITIRQLLNHTNGIYNFVRNPEYWTAVFQAPDHVWDRDEVLTTYVLEPYFAPGSEWRYSNAGYSLLRMIIEEATGSDVSTEIRNRLLEPFELERTFYALEETLPGPVAHGWFDVDGDDSYDDLSGEPTTAFYSSIGGGLFSTAEDLAKWANLLFYERVVVSPETLEQMLEFVPANEPEEPVAAGYGLGVVQFNPALFNGLEAWGHSGNAIGYAAGSIYLPEFGISIGIMVNTEEGEGMQVINNLLNIIMSHPEVIS